MKIKDLGSLIIFIVIAELAGAIGSLFTVSAIGGWYAMLARPEFAPPNWLFAPVWTTLYALMGIAAFLVWRSGSTKREVRIALGVFFAQLVLNSVWTVIFFGLRSPGWAFAEIVLLWLAIIATIIVFARVSRSAAWLLAPYIAWVSFAACLNLAIWLLNR